MLSTLGRHHWTGSMIDLTRSERFNIDFLHCSEEIQCLHGLRKNETDVKEYIRCTSEPALSLHGNLTFYFDGYQPENKSCNQITQVRPKMSVKSICNPSIESIQEVVTFPRNQSVSSSNNNISLRSVSNETLCIKHVQRYSLANFFSNKLCKIDRQSPGFINNSNMIKNSAQANISASYTFDTNFNEQSSQSQVTTINCQLFSNVDPYLTASCFTGQELILPSYDCDLSFIKSLDILNENHLKDSYVEKISQEKTDMPLKEFTSQSSTIVPIDDIGNHTNLKCSFLLHSKNNTTTCDVDNLSLVYSKDMLLENPEIYANIYEDSKVDNTMYISNVEIHINPREQFKNTEELLSTKILDKPKDVNKIKCKKSVHFKDEFGGQLNDVRLIENKDSAQILIRLRQDSFEDTFACLQDDTETKTLIYLQDLPSKNISVSKSSATFSHGQAKSTLASNLTNSYCNFIWHPTFTQPAAQYLAFRQRLESNSVSMENVCTSTSGEQTKVNFSGTIKVKNISYEKKVWLRLTTDRWKSFKDFTATYNPDPSVTNGSHCRYNTFVFQFVVDFLDFKLTQHDFVPPDQIEFAVGFLAGDISREFWDNNDGNNYLIAKHIIEQDFSPIIPNFRDICTQKASNSIIAHRPTLSLHQSENLTLRNHIPSQIEESSQIDSLTNPYTPDYRPNFHKFASLTEYSAWKHYSGEGMYY